MTTDEMQRECVDWYVAENPFISAETVLRAMSGEVGKGGAKTGKKKVRHGPDRLWSRIRRECAIWFAQRHPEMDMKTIGLALGWGNAKSISSSSAVPGSTVGRHRGGGEPCYTPEVRKAQRERDARMVTFIKENPDMSYAKVAKKFGISHSVVKITAREAGIHVGKGGRLRGHGPKPKVSDQRVKKFWKKFPQASLREALRMFGYNTHGGHTVTRLKRLRDEALAA